MLIPIIIGQDYVSAYLWPVGVAWHASVWPNQQYQDEPLTIRTDVVKRGSQRKQFDCEPFLEAGAFCESQGQGRFDVNRSTNHPFLQVLRRFESSLREDESGRPRDPGQGGSGEESGYGRRPWPEK